MDMLRGMRREVSDDMPPVLYTKHIWVYFRQILNTYSDMLLKTEYFDITFVSKYSVWDP